MGSSPGFESTTWNWHALFRLAFAAAPELQFLNLAPYSKSPDHSSIGTPSPGQSQAATFCRLTVSGLFHSPLGVLFTFPSRYWCAIGDQGYLALEGGPPYFPQGFPCPVVLRQMPEVHPLSPTGLSPSLAALPRSLRLGDRLITPWGPTRRPRTFPITPLRHRPSRR